MPLMPRMLKGGIVVRRAQAGEKLTQFNDEVS